MILNNDSQQSAVLSGQNPRVWVLASSRAGEQKQLLALADRLGWPYEMKRIVYRAMVPYYLLGASRIGVELRKSGISNDGWPDLILTASAKNEPLSRWIRKQSGNKTRVVHLGRTWVSAKHFDLVVTTPQYRLPDAPNVQHNTVPMHTAVTPPYHIEDAGWQESIDQLPQPYTALMLGGHSGPYTFDRQAAEGLVVKLNAQVSSTGGSLLVSSSARTPLPIVEYFKKHLTVPHLIHDWKAEDLSNPYSVFLAAAQSVVVTGDSVSMLAEACATLKPVYIADFGVGALSMRHRAGLGLDVLNYFFGRGLGAFQFDYVRNCIYRLAMLCGINRLSRDISLVHQALKSQRRVAWLGERFSVQRTLHPFPDVDQTVKRVKSLINELPGSEQSSVTQAADLSALAVSD